MQNLTEKKNVEVYYNECVTIRTVLHIENNLVIPNQWRNRGQSAPRDFWPGNSADLPGKERQGKMEQKRRKIEKGKMEKWKWKGEKLQNAERASPPPAKLQAQIIVLL